MPARRKKPVLDWVSPTRLRPPVGIVVLGEFEEASPFDKDHDVVVRTVVRRKKGDIVASVSRHPVEFPLKKWMSLPNANA